MQFQNTTMNTKTLLPQSLFVDFSLQSYDPEAFGKAIHEGKQPPKAASVVVDIMERVVELYDRQEIIVPTHAVVNSQELFEFLDGNSGRRNWVAATLGSILGEGFSPRCVNFWKGRMYDESTVFFAFALSIPAVDANLIPENVALPSHGVPVHLTVFEFNRSE